MKYTVLGSGTSSGVPIPTCDCKVCTSDNPKDRRYRTSLWVQWENGSILIDCSADFREQALRQKIPNLDAILFTHAHADHILGIDDLRPYNWRKGGALPAFASTDTCRAIKRTFWYVFEADDHPSVKPSLQLQAVDSEFQILGQKIIPIPVEHGPQTIFGYRIGSMAYLTDVSAIPSVSLDLLKDLDVLFLSALRHRPHPTHLTIEQSVEQALKIQARQTYFIHMSHEVGHEETEQTLPPSIRLAYDGLVVHSKDEGSSIQS